MFENVFFQSKMLINLINDLLDLAKINSLNFKFNDGYFDIKEVVLQACEKVRFIAS